MNNTSLRVASVAVLAMSAALSGCASEWQGLNAWKPKTDPVKPATPFSSALACIRAQLNDAGAGAKPLTITVGMIPDATGRIMPGLRDMVTSTVADITAGSRYFDLTEVGTYGTVVGPTFGSRTDSTGTLLGFGPIKVNSGYQLVGALTQADSSNSDRGVSGGLSEGGRNTIDAAFNNSTSTVAIDLRLVDVSKGLSVAYSTRNLLRVQSTGFSANINFTIGRYGGNFGYDTNDAEGPHQAARELIELSVAELLGQAAHVPYWACLAVNRDHPAVQSMIQHWYVMQSDSQTDLDVRARLRTAGYTVPEPPKSAAQAIAKFQRDSGLVENGRPTFETFAALVARQLPVDAPPTGLPDPSTPLSPVAPAPDGGASSPEAKQ